MRYIEHKGCGRELWAVGEMRGMEEEQERTLVKVEERGLEEY